MQVATTMIGFADIVHDAQMTFHAVMQALSRPGRQIQLPNLPVCPHGLPNGMAAIALTLVDYETPVWLDQNLSANKEVREFFAFHTNAPLTEVQSEAAFAFVTEPALLPEFGCFSQGSLEFPDRSTTLVIEVESLIGGPQFQLQGPGIQTTESIEPTSLPSDFEARLVNNRQLYPCGVDIVLSAGDTIVGLPRSVRVVEG